MPKISESRKATCRIRSGDLVVSIVGDVVHHAVQGTALILECSDGACVIINLAPGWIASIILDA